MFLLTQQPFNVTDFLIAEKSKTIRLIADATCRVPESGTPRVVWRRGKAACGFIITDEQGNILTERAQYLGEMTIPQAEYWGLVHGLDAAVEFGRWNVEVWMDSELVIRQMNGEYCIKSDMVKPLFDEVKKMENRFLGKVSYFHHNRGSFWARKADKLANEEYSRNQAG
jgi:ribonuclease HI